MLSLLEGCRYSHVFRGYDMNPAVYFHLRQFVRKVLAKAVGCTLRIAVRTLPPSETSTLLPMPPSVLTLRMRHARSPLRLGIAAPYTRKSPYYLSPAFPLQCNRVTRHARPLTYAMLCDVMALDELSLQCVHLSDGEWLHDIDIGRLSIRTTVLLTSLSGRRLCHVLRMPRGLVQFERVDLKDGAFKFKMKMHYATAKGGTTEAFHTVSPLLQCRQCCRLCTHAPGPRTPHSCPAGVDALESRVLSGRGH